MYGVANLPADGVFVGREGELSALLDARHDPRVRAVLIAGEPGIGKSRLTAEFAARQTPTTEVLVGRCPESGSDVAFAPFLGVLRDLPGTDRTQLFGAVLTRLEQRAAAHPVVLVLEDLHWADSSSLELFAFLIANLAEPDVLLLGTYRPVCPPGLRRLVAELRRNPTVRHVEPGSFTRHQVGRQLAALLGREPEPRRVTEVLEHSSGNPLFVAALSAAPGLSVDLDALLLAALTDSSDDAGALARTAAVIGSPIDHALLEAAAGLPAAQLHAGLRELVQRQVLTALDSGGTTDIGYEFRHVLLRQAIYADLLAAERIGTHARLAQLISARPELVAAPRREAARAHHAYAAGDLPLALESAWAAAQQAHRIGAHPERLRHLDRVLQLWDRVPDAAHRIAADRLAVLEHVVDAAFHGADTQRGIDAATEALDLLTGATDHQPHTRITQVHPQLRVHLSDSGVAALYYRRGCLANLAGTGGSADLARALELLPEGEPTALRAQVLVDLAATQVFGGDAAAADRTAHAALDVAEQVDTPAVAARAHAFIALSAAESDTAAAHFASARAAADDPATLLSVLTWQCAFDVAMGRYAAAVDAVHEGLRTANDSFQFTDKGPILLVKWAQALNALGQWATARTVIDEALAGPLPGLSAAALSLCHADITLAQGDRATAQQAVDAAAGLLDDNPWATQYRLELRAVQCKLAVHCDDFSHATALLTSTVAEAGVRAYPNDLWPLLALAARLPDPPDLADTAAQLAIASPVAAAHRAVYVAATTGAPALWTEAAASWHALGRPFDHAQALLGYAEAALAHGDRGKARTALKEAADVATGLGATSLHDSVRRTAEHARLPLADSGPDSGRTDAAPSTSGLTRRELDVLRLVSRGLTNRQIAAELFISGNTAGVHISRILAKLGVATRTEAAAYAHRHGLA